MVGLARSVGMAAVAALIEAAGAGALDQKFADAPVPVVFDFVDNGLKAGGR